MDDLDLNVVPPNEEDFLPPILEDAEDDEPAWIDGSNEGDHPLELDNGVHGDDGGEDVGIGHDSVVGLIESGGNEAFLANLGDDRALPPVDNVNRAAADHYLPYTDEEIAEGPKPGLVFDTIDMLYDFYMAHGKAKGLAIAKRSNTKASDEVGLPKYVYLSCDKARTKGRGAQTSKRCECKARISARLRGDLKYEITYAFHEHCHELEPSFSRFIPGHRQVSRAMKRRLEANDITGIRVAKNIRMEEVQAGGPDQLGCLPQDCRNFINATRRLKLGSGDAEAMRQFFLKMRQHDRDFFHLIDVDADGRLRNVIWVHPQSKAAYEDFHDVVCFDTTYLLNKYRMPVASFVGMDHHRQSILLGCALLSHEDTDTFRWLFRTWLTAMGGVQPTGMLTDQCESIKGALRSEMPSTTHRFCLWHIFTKIPMKFKGLRDRYKDAKKQFISMVLDSLTREEFEFRWDTFLDTCELRGHDWLGKLYTERQQWAPVYLNYFFGLA